MALIHLSNVDLVAKKDGVNGLDGPLVHNLVSVVPRIELKLNIARSRLSVKNVLVVQQVLKIILIIYMKTSLNPYIFFYI